MKIGQFFSSEEKIGSLTESGGVLTLAPSHLKIGGLGVSTDALTLTLSGLVSGNIYMVYVVLNAGVPQLVIDTNYNSVGPTGYTEWVLVGAFTATAGNVFGFFQDINTPIREYAYNTDVTATASVTASGFEYGLTGGGFGAGWGAGTNFVRRVRFTLARKSTDHIILEHTSSSGANWGTVSHTAMAAVFDQASSAGTYLLNTSSNTDLDVQFGTGGRWPGLSNAWSGLSGASFKWRVVKISTDKIIKDL